MSQPAKIELDLATDLHARLLAAAQSSNRPVTAVIEGLIRDFLPSEAEISGHHAWFSGRVSSALQDADNPQIIRIPHDAAAQLWRALAETLSEQADGQGA
jgi:hypothetical protein